MMVLQLKFALVVSIVTHVRKRWRNKKGAAEKPLKKVSSTVKRNGVLASVLVVVAVDRAKESAQKGLAIMQSVKAAMMMVKRKHALVVIIVLDARRNAMTTRVVAGNPLRNVLITVKRSMEFAHILDELFLPSFAEFMLW